MLSNNVLLEVQNLKKHFVLHKGIMKSVVTRVKAVDIVPLEPGIPFYVKNAGDVTASVITTMSPPASRVKDGKSRTTDEAVLRQQAHRKVSPRYAGNQWGISWSYLIVLVPSHGFKGSFLVGHTNKRGI